MVQNSVERCKRPPPANPPSTKKSGATFEAVPPFNTVADQWLATRIHYICDYYREAKPRHRDPSHPVSMPLGGETTFCVGRFLSQVADYYHRGREAELGAAGERLVREAAWFRPWIAKLRAQRAAALPADALVATPITSSEELALLTAAFPQAPPEQGQLWIEVLRSNGEPHVLQLPKILQNIGTAYHRGASCALREQDIAAFHALPWAATWAAQYVKKERNALHRQIVTRDVKTHLLLLNCPKTKPEWERVVPLCGAGIEGVYRWRPASWLDDVAGNWTGKAPSVRLSKDQMEAIETLPWFAEWRAGLWGGRKRKVD